MKRIWKFSHNERTKKIDTFPCPYGPKFGVFVCLWGILSNSRSTLFEIFRKEQARWFPLVLVPMLFFHRHRRWPSRVLVYDPSLKGKRCSSTGEESSVEELPFFSSSSSREQHRTRRRCWPGGSRRMTPHTVDPNEADVDKRPDARFCVTPCRKVGLWKVNFLSFAHFVTILSPISLFSCAVHFWVELKARK